MINVPDGLIDEMRLISPSEFFLFGDSVRIHQQIELEVIIVFALFSILLGAGITWAVHFFLRKMRGSSTEVSARKMGRLSHFIGFLLLLLMFFFGFYVFWMPPLLFAAGFLLYWLFHI